MLTACCASVTSTARMGILSKAIAMYEQALAARNDDPRILFSLGMAFVQQGKNRGCTGKA